MSKATPHDNTLLTLCYNTLLAVPRVMLVHGVVLAILGHVILQLLPLLLQSPWHLIKDISEQVIHRWQLQLPSSLHGRLVREE